ncbi:DUF4381 domain-containing protein [Shewanella woodyi]|uniref:DUF4381 domain-containing protein n=1 Tax=Shewanella woodyi (strain ATCC 51908 / MS32) TaxID=392500 RepID=B1KKT4_SHEWM|nr:DUF4381 domain-containing protein [Shewanella woodyi]ACA87301.1 conserved hypothetical protein [Shewanella woodyi ATCC 51908]
MQAAATNPALQALKDIHTPAVVESWPIAPGYWLILLVSVSTLLFTVIWLKRRIQRSAAKRAALMELERLDIHNTNICVEINTLIKRAALSYLPREDVAGLEGQAWYAWINSQVKQPLLELEKLLDRRYQREPLTPDEAQRLKQITASWLKEALPLTQQKSAQSPLSHKQEQELKC